MFVHFCMKISNGFIFRVKRQKNICVKKPPSQCTTTMTSEHEFLVEYAKSDRSSCCASKQKIPKGELRIGQLVRSFVVLRSSQRGKGSIYFFWWENTTVVRSERYVTLFLRRYLWDKFFDNRRSGYVGLTSWEMLVGREKLSPAEQKKLKELIDGGPLKWEFVRVLLVDTLKTPTNFPRSIFSVLPVELIKYIVSFCDQPMHIQKKLLAKENSS